MSGVSIAGVIAGGITLYFTTGNFAAAAFAYGLAAGIESYVLAPDIQGPRLEDRKIQLSTYGAQIPIVFGSVRLAGNIIWPVNFEVEEHSTSQSTKGGGGDTISFNYTATFAVLLCEGPIAAIGRVWMNKKLMYDPNAVVTTDPAISGRTGPFGPGYPSGMTVYLGTETQEPDPIMVAADGSAPAYRGWAYIVFENLELTHSGFGNRPPSVEVEVFTKISASDFVITGNYNGANFYVFSRNPTTGFLTEIPGSPFPAVIEPMGGYSISPYDMVISKNGKYLVVVSYGDFVITVYAINQATGALTAVPGNPFYTLSSVYSVAISPDGKFVFAPDTGNNKIYVFSMNDSTGFLTPVTGSPFVTGNFPLDVAVTKNGKYLTVPSLLDNKISVYSINASTGFLTPVTGSPFASGTNPFAVAVTQVPESFEQLTFVLNAGLPGTISVYKSFISSGVLTEVGGSPFATGANQQGIAITPNNKYVLVLSSQDNAVWVYSLNSASGYLTPVAGSPFAAGIGPTGIDISKDGKFVYITYTESHLPGDPYVRGLLAFSMNDSTGFLIPVTGSPFAAGAGPIPVVTWSKSVESLPVTLGEIVSSLCTRAPFGLDVSDIDVTQLTDLVDGYLVGQQMTRRAAIEPLMAAYFFDCVESDHKLKFVQRGSASAVTIIQDDRAAHQDGDNMPAHLNIVRASELELPWAIDVIYQDKSRNYEPGTQYDRRITRNSNDPRRIELAIVMTAAKAKQVALVNLYLPWLRTRFSFSTGLAYAKYEPTDIITLPTDDVTYVARITRRSDQGNGVLQWEAELEDSSIYTQTGTVSETNYVPQTIRDPGTTILDLLDMPILRDVDNDPGYYVAMGGTKTGWRGAQLFKSVDSGASYAAVLSIANRATIGASSGALGNFVAGNIFDNGNSVTVTLSSGGPLVSATGDQVLNGSNTAVIGAPGRWEVINFKTATLTAANTYLLSGLLRGRRGTEWATGTHLAGDTFIVADLATWQRTNPGSAEIGLARTFKAPVIGSQLSAAVAESFTNSAVGLECYAPVDLKGVRDVFGNLTITWHRRSRYGYGGLHTIVPLGEATESYSTDIMNGAAVVRTIASATPTAAYTSAMQVADWGSNQSAVTVKIYQISATVARGYGLNGTI